jgi:NADPH:quinone reductase-like Zn-dependent oxidoreductase
VKLRYKILSFLVIIVAAGVISIMLVMSHTSPCESAAPQPAGATLMKGVVRRCYGSPEAVVKYEDRVKPSPADDEVLVRVRAASVNPLDYHYVEGTPYLLRLDRGLGKPEDPRLGVDFAGTVEAVGKSVTHFKPGDEVFGGKLGALGEYVSVREERAIALKPANVNFEQAAAVPIAGLTALHALRDKGRVHAGQKVLINGASGGIGTYAVQIAKSMGAEVTGVCSTRNLELARSLGADHVIDYTKKDFTQGPERYDVIIDIVSTHPVLAYRRVMSANGIYVNVGSNTPGNWFGLLKTPLEAWFLSPFMKQKFTLLLSELNREDLVFLASLMQSGKMTSAIDRTYKLSESAQALAYLEKGHARGKVVVTVD